MLAVFLVLPTLAFALFAPPQIRISFAASSNGSVTVICKHVGDNGWKTCDLQTPSGPWIAVHDNGIWPRMRPIVGPVGTCGLTIQPAEPQDYGEWACKMGFVRLNGDFFMRYTLSHMKEPSMQPLLMKPTLTPPLPQSETLPAPTEEEPIWPLWIVIGLLSLVLVILCYCTWNYK